MEPRREKDNIDMTTREKTTSSYEYRKGSHHLAFKIEQKQEKSVMWVGAESHENRTILVQVDSKGSKNT
jgi:hypothetical protein